MIKPPPDAKVFEWPSSTMWIDDEGIVCSVSKKVAPQTLEEIKDNIEDFKKLINGKKVCLLADVTYATETTREVREYVSKEFPKFLKAIAMISDSVLGKMVANIFFTIKSQPYPTRFFNDENEAKEWLKKFL